MTWTLDNWPWWLSRAAGSLVIMAVAYGLGYLLNAIVIRRLAALSGRTRATWDDIVIAELRQRIPLWSLLVGVWVALGRWPLDPHSQRLADDIVFVVAAASVTLAASAMARHAVAAYGQAITPSIPISGLTQTVASIITVTLGLLVVLNGLGVSITPMLTALGVGGLAVALALQEPLSNLFAGLFVTLAGQVRVGDYVKLDGGVEGYIVDFTWRSTRIRMLQNNLVLVPNSKLAQAVLINFSLPQDELAVLVDAGVDYASDLGHVERVTCDVGRAVMREVAGGVETFEPFVRFHTFADSAVNFTVILRGRTYADQYLIKHEFVKRLHARYAQEGIVIPFPMRTLTTREPLAIAAIGTRA